MRSSTPLLTAALWLGAVSLLIPGGLRAQAPIAPPAPVPAEGATTPPVNPPPVNPPMGFEQPPPSAAPRPTLRELRKEHRQQRRQRVMQGFKSVLHLGP